MLGDESRENPNVRPPKKSAKNENASEKSCKVGKVPMGPLPGVLFHRMLIFHVLHKINIYNFHCYSSFWTLYKKSLV